MTKEEAIVQLEWYFEEDNGISADLVTKQAFNTIKMEEIRKKEKIEQDPCETCGYAEGSPFCLQYCPYDAERKKEQEPCDAISREVINNLQKYRYNCGDTSITCVSLASINALPSVTQKSGKWIYDETLENWRCSKCNETPKTMGYVGTADFMAEHFKFCNHCGAKMESEE